MKLISILAILFALFAIVLSRGPAKKGGKKAAKKGGKKAAAKRAAKKGGKKAAKKQFF